MGGNILYLTGMVDKRTMEKYEKEAKEAGRESWYLSWALDTNTEERAKVYVHIILLCSFSHTFCSSHLFLDHRIT